MDKRYKYFSNGTGEIIAISHYAGKTVRGIAKCSPQDNFDLDKGKALACARCTLKIAKKRKKRAAERIQEAKNTFQKAERELKRMHQYYADSCREYDKAEIELRNIVENL